ncbi:MAG: SDR family oxidoreductase [Terriglobia bacterium]
MPPASAHDILPAAPARFLVTGGAGFIGSALVRALLARGQRVRVVDDFSTGLRQNLAEVADQIDLIEGDLVQPSLCRAAVRDVDYVLHQAAIPSVPRSIQAPLRTHEANVTATLNLLLAARDAGCRRLVYASSSSVYGNSEVLPKVETLPPRPRSPYAVSKYAAEQYALLFNDIYGFETVALRYFNIFGPRQNGHSPYSGVLSLWMAAAMAGEPLTVHGDGKQSRDFTFVENAVEANLLACMASDAPGLAINVGAGGRHTLLDVINALEEALGTRVTLRHAEPRPGDVRHSQADISQAHTVLGYVPRVSFSEGLKRTLAWWREQAEPVALEVEWT